MFKRILAVLTALISIASTGSLPSLAASSTTERYENEFESDFVPPDYDDTNDWESGFVPPEYEETQATAGESGDGGTAANSGTAGNWEDDVKEETTKAPNKSGQKIPYKPAPRRESDRHRNMTLVNADAIGYIRIPGLEVDYPILKNKADMPNHYLDYDIYGQKAKEGAVYIDDRCYFGGWQKEDFDNLVIYGHNMQSREMFGALRDYRDYKSKQAKIDFYEKHRIIEITTNNENHDYVICALFPMEDIADGTIFKYWNFLNFDETEKFEQFIGGIKKFSEIDTGVGYRRDDKFITLSTCITGNWRFVVVARRVRPGEVIETAEEKPSETAAETTAKTTKN
jgi:SrtB family sortase